MKKFKLYTSVLMGLLLLTVAYAYIFCLTAPIPADFKYDDNLSAPILIAHAGGEIDGHIYTNSVEAIVESISDKYKFIELDLHETDDDHIVALHDWERFHDFSGHEDESSELELSEFKQRLLFNKFHPATAIDINKLFIGSGVFLVTDKISDYDLLNDQIHISKDSMLVECFTYRDYVRALKKGIKFPMLCMGSSFKMLMYKKLCKYKNVKIITCPVRLLEREPQLLKEFISQGVSVFAYSTNSKDFIHKNGIALKLASGFYTDRVTP